MQIRVTVCVRSVRVTPSTEAEEREGAAAHASVAAPARRTTNDRPRGNTRRATRLHPHAGSRRTRHQPLHVQPARATPSRDARDALGRTPDPGRRAAAAARRKAEAGPNTSSTGDTWPTSGSYTGSRGPDPQRARRRQEPRRNRARAQRHRNTNSTRRRPMVAIDGTCRPRSHSRLTAHRPLTDDLLLGKPAEKIACGFGRQLSCCLGHFDRPLRHRDGAEDGLKHWLIPGAICGSGGEMR